MGIVWEWEKEILIIPILLSKHLLCVSFEAKCTFLEFVQWDITFQGTYRGFASLSCQFLHMYLHTRSARAYKDPFSRRHFFVCVGGFNPCRRATCRDSRDGGCFSELHVQKCSLLPPRSRLHDTILPPRKMISSSLARGKMMLFCLFHRGEMVSSWGNMILSCLLARGKIICCLILPLPSRRDGINLPHR